MYTEYFMILQGLNDRNNRDVITSRHQYYVTKYSNIKPFSPISEILVTSHRRCQNWLHVRKQEAKVGDDVKIGPDEVQCHDVVKIHIMLKIFSISSHFQHLTQNRLL